MTSQMGLDLRLIFSSAIGFMASACVTIESHRELTGAADLKGTCLPGPELVFEAGRFDGRILVGRVLVGAVENEIEVDSNGAEFGTFNVVNVTECQSGKDVQYLIMDVVGGYKRTSDTLLKLKPGYWYGKSYKYAVVDGEPRDCVDVELRLNLPTQNHSMATSGVLVRAAVGKATEVLARSRCISAITESLELTPEQIRQRLKNTAE